MKTPTACNVIAQIALVAALTALVGCKSSSNYQKGAATGAGLVQAADKIEQGITNIDAVLTSMNGLVTSSQGDLTPKYKQFTADVGNLKDSAENVKERVADMRENGNAYLKAWDEQLAQIKNEDIKARSTERKKTVEKELSDIKKSYTEVQISFDPFMSNLTDIQTALGNDLTTGGVDSVKGAVETANKHGTDLKAAMNKLAGEFRDLGVAMSSSAPAGAASTNAPAQ
jgi:Skp family chaperone for outer membrane proteins